MEMYFFLIYSKDICYKILKLLCLTITPKFTLVTISVFLLCFVICLYLCTYDFLNMSFTWFSIFVMLTILANCVFMTINHTKEVSTVAE